MSPAGVGARSSLPLHLARPPAPSTVAIPCLKSPHPLRIPISHATGGHVSWTNKGGEAPAYVPPPQYAYLPAIPSYPLTLPRAATTAPPLRLPVPLHLQHQQQQLNYPQQQPTQASAAPVFQYHYQPMYHQPASDLSAFPQAQHQAQQLFQRDAQTITRQALESVKAALANGDGNHKSESKRKAVPRKAAGQTWEDPTLADWPENDYRLFCGDLGNEVNDEVLTKAFSRFSSFTMARVVRDKRTGKTRGYGFVSFINPSDLALALKEMNGKYVGNRPIKLRKSTWKERNDIGPVDRHKVIKKVKASRKTVLHR